MRLFPLLSALAVCGCDRLLAFAPGGPPSIDARSFDRAAADGRADQSRRDGPSPESGCRACLVGKTCFMVGAPDPADPDKCRICDPDLNAVGWSPATGCVITLAGNGTQGHQDGPGSEARFSSPRDLTVGPDGTVYVADTDNHAIRTIIKGVVSTLTGGPTKAGSRDGALAIAQIREPRAVSLDDQGALYVGDTGNDRIRKVEGGLVKALFDVTWPMGATWYGQKIYVSSANRISERALDGTAVWTAGTGTTATCSQTNPQSCFADGALAVAMFNSPRVLAVQDTPAGPEVIVPDEFNNRIRGVTSKGVRTIAGEGPAGSIDSSVDPLAARFMHPTGVALRNGMIYVADEANSKVRVVTPGASVGTVCGSHVSSTTPVTDGPLSKVTFRSVRAIAFDSAGRLYIADETAHQIRVLRLP